MSRDFRFMIGKDYRYCRNPIMKSLLRTIRHWTTWQPAQKFLFTPGRSGRYEEKIETGRIQARFWNFGNTTHHRSPHRKKSPPPKPRKTKPMPRPKPKPQRRKKLLPPKS